MKKVSFLITLFSVLALGAQAQLSTEDSLRAYMHPDSIMSVESDSIVQYNVNYATYTRTFSTTTLFFYSPASNKIEVTTFQIEKNEAKESSKLITIMLIIILLSAFLLVTYLSTIGRCESKIKIITFASSKLLYLFFVSLFIFLYDSSLWPILISIWVVAVLSILMPNRYKKEEEEW